MATSITEELVPKFRRAIDEVEEPYTYPDNALVEYIEDAISQSWLEWRHTYTVDRDTHTIEQEVVDAHQMFFVMYAKLEMMKRQPNLSFRSGSISVTRKSDDKKMLQNKIDDVINELVNYDCVGLVNSELDQYANRLENWIYIEQL